MKIWKKICAVLAVACIASVGGAFAACAGEELPEVSSSEFTGNYSCTVKAMMEDNTPVANVKFVLTRNDRVLEEAVSDANGMVSFSKAAGKYVIEYQSGIPVAPEGIVYEPSWYTKPVTFQKDAHYDFVVCDVTPDGSKEKPFDLVLAESGVGEVTLPAGAIYYYEIDAKSVKDAELYIESSAVEVTWNKTTYTPVDGIIKLPMGDVVNGTHEEAQKIMVHNLTNAEATITARRVVPLGDLGNPYILELGVATKVEKIKEGNFIYYKWTATADGIFTITASSNRNDISMQTDRTENGTLGSGGTNGALTSSIAVKAGESVLIAASATKDYDDPSAVTYTITASFVEDASGEENAE